MYLMEAPLPQLKEGFVQIYTEKYYWAGPEINLCKTDKHYPSKYGQISLATAVTNFTKPKD